MTDRKPTDAAIVKGFNDFERGFNIYIEWHRTAGEVRFGADAMWAAHNAYRQIAVAAQERIDARKEGK